MQHGGEYKQKNQEDHEASEREASDESRKVTPHVAAKRRERPPLRYTQDFPTPTTVSLDVIGVVRSPYKVRPDKLIPSLRLQNVFV